MTQRTQRQEKTEASSCLTDEQLIHVVLQGGLSAIDSAHRHIVAGLCENCAKRLLELYFIIESTRDMTAN